MNVMNASTKEMIPKIFVYSHPKIQTWFEFELIQFRFSNYGGYSIIQQNVDNKNLMEYLKILKYNIQMAQHIFEEKSSVVF